MTARFRGMSGGFGRRAAAARPPSRDLKPISSLLPLVFRYRRQLALALISLVVATAATLVVPVAVRRIIDHGFSNAHRDLINQYFAVMLLVVAVLAVASASRFYFVSWLGERSVADLRDKVFAHLLDLSPAFYDTAMTGEVMSRLTADTLQIKTLFSSAASIALRNSLMLAGAIAMMLVTSLRLSGLVLLAIPLIVLPLVLFGREVRRLSREAQDALAGSAALAQEALSNIQAVEAACQEPRFRQQFADATERSFLAARGRTFARALLTGAIIFIASGAVVGILWLGAQDVLLGRLTGGTLGQFVIYAALAASSLGALSEVWGEVQLSAGAAERLLELTRRPSRRSAPRPPRSRCPPRRSAPWHCAMCISPIRAARSSSRPQWPVDRRRARRDGGHRRPLGRRQDHDLQPAAAFLRCRSGRHVMLDGVDISERPSRRYPRPHGAGPAGRPAVFSATRPRQHPLRPGPMPPRRRCSWRRAAPASSEFVRTPAAGLFDT